MTTPGRWAMTLAVYLLLALAALATPLEASQPLHAHHSSSPGLYNAECQLACLTGTHASAPLPAPAGADASEVVAGLVLAVPADPVVASALRHTDPRAPPLA